MIRNHKENPEEFKDYHSELLLNILNTKSAKTKNIQEKELFVDEN